jgi:hypothetical protein
MGTNILTQYTFSGVYDFVNILEAPDNWTIARVAMELGSRGALNTTTLAALYDIIIVIYDFWCLGPELNRHGGGPPRDFKTFEEMGYSIILYPTICVTTSFSATREMLNELKEKGIIRGGWAKEGISFDEFINFLGLEKYRKMEQKYLRKV